MNHDYLLSQDDSHYLSFLKQVSLDPAIFEPGKYGSLLRFKMRLNNKNNNNNNAYHIVNLLEWLCVWNGFV